MAKKALNPYCKQCPVRKDGHCGGKFGTTNVPVCERFNPDPFGVGKATENVGKMFVAGIGGVLTIKATDSILDSFKK